MATPVITNIPFDKLALSEPMETQNGPLKIRNITLDGKPLRVRLSEGLHSTTPFPPSVFNGSGLELRKSIVFNVPEKVHQGIAAIEDFCKKALAESHPGVDMFWNPACKLKDNFGPQLRAKIHMEYCRF